MPWFLENSMLDPGAIVIVMEILLHKLSQTSHEREQQVSGLTHTPTGTTQTPLQNGSYKMNLDALVNPNKVSIDVVLLQLNHSPNKLGPTLETQTVIQGILLLE